MLHLTSKNQEGKKIKSVCVCTISNEVKTIWESRLCTLNDQANKIGTIKGTTEHNKVNVEKRQEKVSSQMQNKATTGNMMIGLIEEKVS